MPTSEIQFQTPSPGQTVSDWIDLTLVTPLPVNIATVEYLIGSRRLGVASSSPFTMSWNPATLISDGTQELRAIAKDAFGVELARCSQLFNINYNGNVFEILSPAHGASLSGTAGIQFHANDSLYWPSLTTVYVDGISMGKVWSDNNWLNDLVYTFNLDTTLFLNGEHEISLTFDSNFNVDTSNRDTWQSFSARGALIRTMTFANTSTTVIGIRPDMHNLELDLSETATITCFALKADGSETAATGITFSSDTPSVASVDSSSGVVTANSEGIAYITVTSATYSRTSRTSVSVRANHNISHFSGSGEFLTAFDDTESIFAVSSFWLTDGEVNNSATLDSEAKLIGINTLETGLYTNVRDISKSFDYWKWYYDQAYNLSWIPARDKGYHFMFGADEVCRSPGEEAWFLLNWPDAGAAIGHESVVYAFQGAAAIGTGIGVQVVDEASLLWRNTPLPQAKVGDPGSFTSIVCSGMTCTVYWTSYGNSVNPSVFALTGSSNGALNTTPGVPFVASNMTADSFDFTPLTTITGTFDHDTDPDLEFLWWSNATQWNLPCNPFVPNTAIRTLADWMHEATIHISWPALGNSGPEVQDAWMGKTAIANGISDFNSHYWDSQQVNHTYPWVRGTYEEAYWMTQRFMIRQNLMERTRPQLMLVAASGTAYHKNTAGTDFNPPLDTFASQGSSPELTMALIVKAAMLGCASVRIYEFDRYRPGRTANDPANGVFSWTGIYYEGLTRPIWRAVGYACKLLTTTLRPFILGTAISSPAIGMGIVSPEFEYNIHTAARESSLGRLLMVLNITDGDLTATVLFGSLRTGQTITRYRCNSDSIAITALSDTTGETIDMKPGAFFAYLFPFSGATTFAAPVTFVPQPYGG